jgi:hypothetical protein
MFSLKTYVHVQFKNIREILLASAAGTGTLNTPRKAQNITPASLPQNNPPEGSHTITTIFTKTY